MKNSLKQMMRTPVKTALFLALTVLAALLITLGASVWMKSYTTMAVYEDRFITIGTVRQVPGAFEQTLQWDAEQQSYQLIKKEQFTSYRRAEELDFPGAVYLSGPEVRAYYGSYTPEYVKMWKSTNPDRVRSSFVIVEFSPLEDCVPGESVQIKITKVVGGDKRLADNVVWFCDHKNPEPEAFYGDKTYVAALCSYRYIHGTALQKAYEEAGMGEPRIDLEYIPYPLDSEIFYPDGSRAEDAFRGGREIFELKDGFYESDAGRRLLAMTETMEWGYDIQPVTGTGETCLLMPFYNGDSFIMEGRDIDREEYETGSKVCLAPKTFMENNGLALGDKVTVRLLFTNGRKNAGRDFWLDGSFSCSAAYFDENGEALVPFETSEYTVVGIYDTVSESMDAINTYTSGSDELIVPLKSIKEREGRNLMDVGPMTDRTASFRIPNGTIEEFQLGFAQCGIDDLEFTFYDMGYSALKAGMDDMRNLSFLLLASGILLAGLLLVFFSHLFITKQAKRTAIERSLGMRPMQCRWSMLSGFLLLVLFGSIIGSVAGIRASADISAENAGNTYFDTAFTAGAAHAANEVAVEEVQPEGQWLLAVCCATALTAAGGVIAFVKMNKSLKKEPMQLLAEREKE